jgi:hypothetical protein
MLQCPTPVPHRLSLKEAGRAIVRHKHGQAALSGADPYFFVHHSGSLTNVQKCPTQVMKPDLSRGTTYPGVLRNHQQCNTWYHSYFVVPIKTIASRNTTAMKSLSPSFQPFKPTSDPFRDTCVHHLKAKSQSPHTRMT